MALIQCPKCGENVSDTSKECIHCGYPLKTKNVRKINKRAVLIVAVVLIIILVILVFMCLSKKEKKHTIQNTALITLIECSQSSTVKDMLGDNYEHKSGKDSTSDRYTDIHVGDLECKYVELFYDKTGNYERVYIMVAESEKEVKDIVVKDLIAQYGDEYYYEKSDFSENGDFEVYDWTISQERRVEVGIVPIDDGVYRTVINSYYR